MHFSALLRFSVTLLSLWRNHAAHATKELAGLDSFPTMSAQEASLYDSPSLKGFLFRGDSRLENIIFLEGFVPRGNNMRLLSHLSFHPDSGYVSTTRSEAQAELYAFGRTGSKVAEGRVYMLDPDMMPRGYWIPGLFPHDRAVLQNQEFAVRGAIPPEAVIGCHIYDANQESTSGKRHGRREWVPNRLTYRVGGRGKSWKAMAEDHAKSCFGGTCWRGKALADVDGDYDVLGDEDVKDKDKDGKIRGRITKPRPSTDSRAPLLGTAGDVLAGVGGTEGKGRKVAGATYRFLKCLP